CAVMQRFPIGMPKIMVSTMASGDVRGYVGYKDIVMFYPVGDISINRVTKRIFSNAVRAMAGMLKRENIHEEKRRVQVAVTVFGVVQPCAEHAKDLLEEKGFEVILFHTSGTGGMALEDLVKQGEIDAVLDVSTTELADEVVGGVLSAGPHRMEAAGDVGIPQVIVPGAIDLVNFKTPETVPEKWKDRVFYRHTPHITLMRTSPEESATLGRLFAKKINRAKGETVVLIPTRGFSAYDSPQGPKAISLQGDPAPRPWFWPGADQAFYQALKENLDHSRIPYHELSMHVNEPGFAERAVCELEALLRKKKDRE
ncbi:MAG: Tm-1-like ATP-binding domain-containing protein, partial [Deltaproteobacteria bacterium]